MRRAFCSADTAYNNVIMSTFYLDSFNGLLLFNDNAQVGLLAVKSKTTFIKCVF